ncbi:hypothetical protein DXG01_001824 [Tephrocybe rancida]|nr:hypothetical protein DXG01_001824 [Tephrocybe rancida]
MTGTCSKATTTQSGKKISSPPPLKRGCKRAMSVVDTAKNSKKKKKGAVESSEEEHEEQEEKKSRKNACKKSHEADKSKKTTIANTEPVHLTRAEQAFVDQNISIAPSMCLRTTATDTTVTAPAPAPPVSAHQRHSEACAEHAAVVSDDEKVDMSSSDSSSSDDHAQSHIQSDDSSTMAKSDHAQFHVQSDDSSAEAKSDHAQSCVQSDNSSVMSTTSCTLPATITPGDETPNVQRLGSCGPLTSGDMARVNAALIVPDHGSELTATGHELPTVPGVAAIPSTIAAHTDVQSIVSTDDTHMTSPPLSPVHDLQGASQTMGGIS